VWVGGDKLVGVARRQEALAAGSGDLTFQHLSGVEVDGQLPIAASVAVGNRHLAVVALYGSSSVGYGSIFNMRVHLFDRSTLAKVWSADLGTTENSDIGIGVGADRLVVSNKNRLLGLDIASGAVAWNSRPYADVGDSSISLGAVGPKHAFIKLDPYGPLDVVELSTGVFLGPLEVGDLFRPLATAYSVIANENGAFVWRKFSDQVTGGFQYGDWTELKAERTRPAVIMDPPVLALAHGGTPVSFRLAERFNGSVDVEFWNLLELRDYSTPEVPGRTALTVPGDGSVATAWLQLSPSRIPYIWGAPVAGLSGQILFGGQVVNEEFAELPVVSGVPSLADHKIQLASGFDFTKASTLLADGGLLFVGYPDFRSAGIPGSGKVEVFNAATGAHVRTISRPAANGSGGFGMRLLAQNGKLLVSAPSLPDQLPRNAKKIGMVYVFEVATGSLLASIPNPVASLGFGAELASSGSHFAVSALNPSPEGIKSKNAVSLFRWDNYQRVYTKVGNSLTEFGSGIAINGSELLVGEPLVSVKANRQVIPNVGRIQSLQMPKGKNGPDWFSPWLAVEKKFGIKLMTDGNRFVACSGEGTVGDCSFQVFDGVRGAARFMLRPEDQAGFRHFDATMHSGNLCITNARDLVFVSLEDGAVPMEIRMQENFLSEITSYALDSNSNLYWLDSGKLFRADKEDLGGFAWWAHASLPGSGAADPAADANGNRQPDLVDYVTDRAGVSPVSVSVSNEILTANVNPAVPRDVCVRIEVQDFAGGWQTVGSWAGGLWLNGDLSQGVPVERTWAQPLQSRAVYTWLGREE